MKVPAALCYPLMFLARYGIVGDAPLGVPLPMAGFARRAAEGGGPYKGRDDTGR